MDGVTDPALRHVLAELGGYDLMFSEFLRVVDRPAPEKSLLRCLPELRTQSLAADRTPVLLQLLGSDPKALAETAARAVKLGALGVDLNLGCPARRVNQHDGGAALLRRPDDITQILLALRDVLPPPLTLSAKLRLAWSDPETFPELALAVQAGGADFMSVHARTRMQGYLGRADWRWIAEVMPTIRIPILINGDVLDRTALTQAQALGLPPAFMLGRGALSRPKLALELKDPRIAPASKAEIEALIQAYLSRYRATPGLKRPERAALAREKQWIRMLLEQDPAWKPRWKALKNAACPPR